MKPKQWETSSEPMYRTWKHISCLKNPEFLTLKLERNFRIQTMVWEVGHFLNQNPQMSNKCSRTISYCHNFSHGCTTKTKFGKKKPTNRQFYKNEQHELQVAFWLFHLTQRQHSNIHKNEWTHPLCLCSPQRGYKCLRTCAETIQRARRENTGTSSCIYFYPILLCFSLFHNISTFLVLQLYNLLINECTSIGQICSKVFLFNFYDQNALCASVSVNHHIYWISFLSHFIF